MTELECFLEQEDIAFQQNVSLKKKTWIKQGGVCSFWITPHNIKQLHSLCSFLYEKEILFELVGQTSNLFFSNSYNPSVIISTIKVTDYAECDNDTICCECGVSVAKLARECVNKGYKGFFGLIELPGTVGAAIYNNASCFGCSLSTMLMNITYLSPSEGLITLSNEELAFTHRSSVFKRHEKEGVILSINLRIDKSGDKSVEIEKAEDVRIRRKMNQEGSLNNLGSIYSRRQVKRNLRNIIGEKIANLLFKLSVINKRAKILKKIILLLYGYKHLDKYISDKNINTFIWRDDESELAFEHYKRFMKMYCEDLEMEIEEKKNR
ncbi:FAD-binding protein [Bacteroides sp. OttesenSCG-928-D19]|nr:FAD-binding protein [Bacteroides sp. OttesenSCG-928-D19]